MIGQGAVSGQNEIVVGIFERFVEIKIFNDAPKLAHHFFYRLPQPWGFSPDSNDKILNVIWNKIEGDLGISITHNGYLLASNINPYMSSGKLIVGNINQFSDKIFNCFDIVEQRCAGGINKYFENSQEHNFIYIDFDLRDVEIYYEIRKKKGVHSFTLDVMQYIEHGLEPFTEWAVGKDEKLEVRLLELILEKSVELFNSNHINLDKVENVVLGGASNFYFNKSTVSSNTDMFLKKFRGISNIHIDSLYQLVLD